MEPMIPLLDSAVQLPTPRHHHYAFSHQALPELLARGGAATVRRLRAYGAQLAVWLWQRLGEALPPEQRLAPNQLTVHPVTAPGYEGVLLCLPPAHHHGEAHMVALLHHQGRPRLFLLARSEGTAYKTTLYEQRGRELVRLCTSGAPHLSTFWCLISAQLRE